MLKMNVTVSHHHNTPFYVHILLRKKALPSQNVPTLGKIVYACIPMPLCSYVLHYLILSYGCKAFLIRIKCFMKNLTIKAFTYVYLFITG